MWVTGNIRGQLRINTSNQFVFLVFAGTCGVNPIAFEIGVRIGILMSNNDPDTPITVVSACFTPVTTQHDQPAAFHATILQHGTVA
jgi:hypothetical protein